MLRYVIAVIALLLLAPVAHALDAKKHAIYTQRAYELYRSHCQPGAPKSLGKKLAQGSRDEDEKDLIERGTNWHFYNRDQQIPTRVSLPINRVLDRVFDYRISAMQAAFTQPSVSDEDRYYLAGRVLHYIQDMSVPAHVVPIYHMKFLFIDDSDKLDAYTLSDNDMDRVDQSLRVSCREMPQMKPRVLLESSAGVTLDAIQKPVPVRAIDEVLVPLRDLYKEQLRPRDHGQANGPQQGGHWGYFWCYQDMPGVEYCPTDNSWLGKGFGNYGVYGNNFGNGLIPYHCHLSHYDGALDAIMSCKAVEIDAQTYISFYTERYKTIMHDTLRFLSYLEGL